MKINRKVVTNERYLETGNIPWLDTLLGAPLFASSECRVPFGHSLLFRELGDDVSFVSEAECDIAQGVFMGASISEDSLDNEVIAVPVYKYIDPSQKDKGFFGFMMFLKKDGVEIRNLCEILTTNEKTGRSETLCQFIFNPRKASEFLRDESNPELLRKDVLVYYNRSRQGIPNMDETTQDLNMVTNEAELMISLIEPAWLKLIGVEKKDIPEAPRRKR